MLAPESESMPVKEDSAKNTDVALAVESGVNTTEPTTNNATTEPTTTTTTSNASTTARFQFGQKAKLFRDMIAQHKIKIDTDHSQLIIIIFLSCLVLVATLTALTTNSWSCDGEKNFGLWKTCHKPVNLVVGDDDTADTTYEETSSNNTAANVTNTSVAKLNGIVCTKQTFHEVKIEFAEQSRIDQVTASQVLIVFGTVLYVVSVAALALAFKFIKVKNLNYVRNSLVISMFVQIISFFMQLIGFFLFVMTDRVSISVSLLFVYFALAMFATNIINFITIEYKSYKLRQLSI